MSMKYGQKRHSNIRVNGTTYELIIEKTGDQGSPPCCDRHRYRGNPADQKYYYSVVVDNADGYIDGYAPSIMACSVAARDDVAWFAC